MTPRQVNGFWWIDYRDARGEHHQVGPFDTNSQAWRWIDRHHCQPVSKAEDRGDFAFDRSAGAKGL